MEEWASLLEGEWMNEWEMMLMCMCEWASALEDECMSERDVVSVNEWVCVWVVVRVTENFREWHVKVEGQRASV